MPELRARIRIAPVAFGASLALSALIVGTAMFGEHGIDRHEKLKSELEKVRVLNDSLKGDNLRLKEQAKALRSNPEYIESVIRDELGWVKKDEMVFIFPSQRPEAEASKGARDAGEGQKAPPQDDEK